MALKKPLVINNWQLGIGDSPYTGFSQMKNVDIFTKPGALKIAQKLEQDTQTIGVVTELIQWFVQDPNTGTVYGLDRNGNLYKSGFPWTVITGHGAVGVNGNGLAIWKDYLFYFRQTRIDVYGPLSGVPAWTLDWEAVTLGVPYDLKNNDFHPAVSSGQRFVLYIGNRNFVDTLEQNAGQVFNPTIRSTWTYNSQDLELGSYYRISTLEEAGSNIAIGTYIGLNKEINTADMFFWDGVSDFITGGNTIYFADNGVWQCKNVNNALYTVAGTGKTRLFASNTGVAQEVKRFNNIDLDPTNQLNPYQGAIDLFDGELLLGVGKLGGSSGNLPLGVYAYRNTAYALKNVISTGEYGVTDGVAIGAIKVHTPTSYLVSWYDLTNASFGVDSLENTFYTGYTASAESQIQLVATDDDPVTFEKCEIRLGKPIKATDKVKVSLRLDLDSTWVLASEFLGTDYVGKTVVDKTVKNIGYFKNVQVKVELDTDPAETESPELISVSFS